MRLALPVLSLLALAGARTSGAQEAQKAPAPAVTIETVETLETKVDAGTSPVVRGEGVKRTVTCNRGRVTVEGQRNEVVMRGPCERVAIHGQGHRIAIEQVGTLSVLGSGHRVQWVSGIDGKQPKITNRASGSSVDRITAQDFAALPVPTSHD